MAVETVTLTRKALDDLLTSAAMVGRETGAMTRGDYTARLRTYGLIGLDQDRAIAQAERATKEGA